MRATHLIDEIEFLTIARTEAPTLASMWIRRGRAISQLTEWDGGKNFAQIQRDPYYALDERAAALREHIRMLEMVLLHGKADYDVSGIQPVAYMGGLLDLGLWPTQAELLFMRPPQEITGSEYFDYLGEFLTEFTIAPTVRDREAAKL